MAPRRYLVIANQTLAEAELTEAIRQRQRAGPSSFYLLVPNTEIILSILPRPISKWLGMDPPHRLHRHTGLPVTTITAKRVI
jgi:hypothetical protein